MKKLMTNAGLVLLTTGLLLAGCDDESTPTSPEPDQTWQTVFEDNFDGTTLNTNDWIQIEDPSNPYSLTGSGELKIDGTTGEEDGAFFIYNTDISGSYVKVLTKFRTTQNDPSEDDVEVGILLNADITTMSSYVLIITSDQIDNIRDYTLLIFKFVDDDGTVLIEESIGGATPQISAGNDYILEGTNTNGTITFTIKDGSGTELKSISVEDTSLSEGKAGFSGDLNIGTSGAQSIYFDYVRIQKYQ